MVIGGRGTTVGSVVKSGWFAYRPTILNAFPVSSMGYHYTGYPIRNFLSGQRKLISGGSDLSALARRIHRVIGRFCTEFSGFLVGRFYFY